MKSIILTTLFLILASTCYANPIKMKAICMIESNCDEYAIGEKGERGAWQMMPSTIKEFCESGVPDEYCADRYMDWCYKVGGSVDDALIVWNFGYGNWKKYKRGEKQLPKTTKEYLKKYHKLTGGK